MASLASRLNDFASRVGAEIKAVRASLAGYVTTSAHTTALSGKANLSSPALTGVPTAPTAAPGTSTTQVATTAFVQAAVPTGGAAPTAMTPVTATGTGASQNITLPESGLTPKDVIVVVNGMVWHSSEYTISGTTLTITTNEAGDSIEVRRPAGATGPKGDPGTGGGSSAEWFPEPPWTKRVCSRWKSGAGSSAQITATSLRAQPFDIMGRKIDAVEFHVQGSITAGQSLHVGIYDSDPVSGMPTTLLWQNEGGYLISSGGAGTKSLATGTLTPNNSRVWVAMYLTSGTTQFVTGASSGVGEREFGLSPGGTNNVAIQALNCSTAWAGTMPSTFTFDPTGAGVSTGGNYINFYLNLPVPTP